MNRTPLTEYVRGFQDGVRRGRREAFEETAKKADEHATFGSHYTNPSCEDRAWKQGARSVARLIEDMAARENA